MCLKKLNRPSIEKVKRPFKKFQSLESSKGLLTGAKKRIKQKSLATIVSNNLKKAVPSATALPKRSILKKAGAVDSSKNLKPALSKLSKDVKSSTKDARCNLPNKAKPKANQSTETVMSFTNQNKANPIQTILARKRKLDTDKPKKTLSSIFKVRDTKGVKLLTSNVQLASTDNKFPNKKQKTEVPPEMASTNPTPDPNKESQSDDELKKSRNKFEKNSNANNEFKRKNTHSHSHQSTKFFSLFKNNPSIPNIGQRFVRPVDEEVFSADKFSELDIHKFSVLNLEQNMNITTMTTVQKKAIPVILSGSDTLIRSQTGSGKTLTYALPIIEKLQSVKPKLSRNSGINALIILPTRELALQTYECFLKLIKVSVICMYACLYVRICMFIHTCIKK
jgi:hypothetical protein